jgi:orotate phosphoribosyltransferase
MTLLGSPELQPLIERLGILLKRAGCYNENRNWVDIDFVWYDMDLLKDFVANMTQIIEKLRERLGFSKLVLPDKVAGPFGILPILLLVSQNASPAIPFVIWKEMARPATGESLIFGKLSDGDELLLVNDVINYGVALAHMKNDLETYREQKHMRYTIKGIVTVVDRELGGLDFVEKSTKIRPISLIRISALKNSHSSE